MKKTLLALIALGFLATSPAFAGESCGCDKSCAKSCKSESVCTCEHCNCSNCDCDHKE